MAKIDFNGVDYATCRYSTDGMTCKQCTEVVYWALLQGCLWYDVPLALFPVPRPACRRLQYGKEDLEQEEESSGSAPFGGGGAIAAGRC